LQGGGKCLNSEIQSFSIDVAPQILSDLQQRLKNTRWTSQIDGTGWEAGTDVHYLKDLVCYWEQSFHWPEQQRLLNQFEHFKTTVDGIGIHFIHARGKGPAPLPLILTHGYPDSFYRFIKLIPMLTDPVSHGGRAEDAFDVGLAGRIARGKKPGSRAAGRCLARNAIDPGAPYLQFIVHQNKIGAKPWRNSAELMLQSEEGRRVFTRHARRLGNT
jgi:hypothetical protein